LTNVLNTVLQNVLKAHKKLNEFEATKSVDHLGITDQFPKGKILQLASFTEGAVCQIRIWRT